MWELWRQLRDVNFLPAADSHDGRGIKATHCCIIRYIWTLGEPKLSKHNGLTFTLENENEKRRTRNETNEYTGIQVMTAIREQV